ncbi:outer membrane lipoprotein-sorting protein [Edaphobacter bradus]|uniref:outer membrane lipoprotein-sorting protein n=1 Tax=Edaphobacter bradus TaxID=2259016 RepID=UPI0021E0393A|nr:outer membrane lipoprotein-sorting protein [Edaphobacter bradus]
MKKKWSGVAAGLLCLTPALTGCLSHTRIVPKTRVADVVISTSLDHMADQLSRRYADLHTFNASVEMSGITGGNLEGKETQSLSFAGYILMRKPEYLRVLLLVPLVRTQALDMVSDGDNFKLLVPSRHKAYVGNNTASTHSKNGLENLRPDVFFDSMFIQGPGKDEIISMTTDIRIIENEKKKKDLIEEPAYALQILAKPEGQTVRTLRVIHINSTDLLPYQQDIYDKNGQVVTKAYYSKYQFYGETPFPTSIRIERPKDHYSLTVAITKLTLNGHFDDDQFELKIPENIAIETMK